MDDRGEGCFTIIGSVLVFAGLVAIVAHDAGHKQGVKDHAAGRYVVVQMPDGTEQVCAVKEAGQ